MLELREDQLLLVDRVRAELRSGKRSVLMQLPTGGGKTVIAAHMIKSAVDKGHRVWFNVHRRELVYQSVAKLRDAAGIEPGVVAAGVQGNRHLPVQVCMVGSLRQRRSRLEDPKLIIWDEAHHLAAGSWSTIFESYPDARHIGLTATPQRLDGTGLGRWFESLVIGPSTAELIEDGHLSGYRLFAPSKVNLAGVHTVAGEFNRKELDEAMKKSSVVGDVITHYTRHCMDKRCIVFAWSISASKDLADQFSRRGIRAAHVDGKTPQGEREAVMNAFRAGSIKVLCNVDLFGEGVDVPTIEAVALLRPTKSLSLYLQQVGRALRPSPGKEHAIILDHAGNCDRFGLPDDEREWSLDGARKSKRSEPAPLRRCPVCFSALRIGAEKCSVCGHLFPVAERVIEQLDGELEEISKEQLRQQRLAEQRTARTLDELIEVGRMRGYKSPEKWAKHVHASRLAKMAGRDALMSLMGGN